jgi:hypothetical protein
MWQTILVRQWLIMRAVPKLGSLCNSSNAVRQEVLCLAPPQSRGPAVGDRSKRLEVALCIAPRCGYLEYGYEGLLYGELDTDPPTTGMPYAPYAHPILVSLLLFRLCCGCVVTWPASFLRAMCHIEARAMPDEAPAQPCCADDGLWLLSVNVPGSLKKRFSSAR